MGAAHRPHLLDEEQRWLRGESGEAMVLAMRMCTHALALPNIEQTATTSPTQQKSSP